MTDCPYPDCSGTVKMAGAVGHCPKCGHPVFDCPNCHAHNRAFAHFCRRCRTEVAFPVFSPGDYGEGLLEALARLNGEVPVDDEFWSAPAACCGYLWALSTRGQVWRLVLGNRTAGRAAPLGDAFGKATFCIRNLSLEEGRPADPHLIAASKQSVKSVNLATNMVHEWLTVEGEDTLLADMRQDGYVTVEADEKNIYALGRRPKGYFLARHVLATGEREEHFVGDAAVAGPLRVGDRICVYSAERFFALEDGRLKTYEYPVAGRALLSPSEVRGFRFASGTLPWRGLQDEVYVPGASSGSPAFLYMNLKSYPRVSANLGVQHGEAFSQAADGRLLVASPGKLEVYDGPAATGPRRDPQLTPTGAEYSDGPFAAYFVRAAAAGEKIRFYFNGKTQDAGLHGLGDLIDPIAFLQSGPAYVLAYFNTKDNKLGFAVWDV